MTSIGGPGLAGAVGSVGGPGLAGAVGSVPAAFARCVRARPNAPAVNSGDEVLTYAGLDGAANRLAHHLRAAGVGPESVVGLLLGPHAGRVVALLAILKAGAAYLALEPGHPRSRQEAIVADAGVRVLITEERLRPSAPDADTIVSLDRDRVAIDRRPAIDLEIEPYPDNAAYLSYTSGSTGAPKGVCVPHGAVLRLVLESDYVDIRPDDAFLQMAPLAFDASTFEVWGALLNGARLVVFPAAEPSPGEIVEVVRRAGVTVLWLTAGLFHRVVDGPVAGLAGLRYLLAGGDTLSVPRVNRVLAALPGLRLINGYGPTENTTFTACHPIDGPIDGDTVPIGRPINGTDVRVLDERLRPVPDGEPGELYVRGRGLARGYLSGPATAERFVADLDDPGQRMYRTGDAVRRGEDGVLEFLGRLDRQVKIRGFRVEPGEVEAAIAEETAVAEVAVVAQPVPGGDRRLVAFVVPARGSRLSVLALRRHLARRLPPYTVPSSIIPLEALPLTGNGKVDRAALAARTGVPRPEVSARYAGPRNPVEAVLARVWADLMGMAEVGVHDDFFELGGYSLLGMQITMEIRREYGVAVPPRSFYEEPTVAGLARIVADRTAAGGGGDGP